MNNVSYTKNKWVQLNEDVNKVIKSYKNDRKA